MKLTQKFLISLLIACFGVFVFSANGVKAAEGDCYLEYCYVPAPTVLGPVLNQATSASPAIIGLTWKTTVVKVFLDGRELKNVQQVKHEDYYASFYVKPDFDLKPGKHFVYTIAYSENPSEFGQSQESTYIYFKVPVTAINSITQVRPIDNIVKDVPKKPATQISVPEHFSDQSQVIVEPTTPNDRDFIIESGSPRFEVEAGKIEGGVSITGEGMPEPVQASEYDKKDISDLQQAATFEQIGEKLNEEFQSHLFAKKMERNRILGLSMLGVLLLLVLCWFFCSRFTIKHELEKLEKDVKPGEVPEAPQDPRTIEPTDLQVPTVEMEPINLEEPPSEYWGEASEQAFQDNKDNENNWK